MSSLSQSTSIEHPPIRKAVFPVAGLGSRLLPATKSIPKEMLPINDLPLIHYAIEEARKAGIEEFIFVTGQHREVLESYLNTLTHLKGKTYITEQEQPLGLGHAIWCSKEFIQNEPFAIILPDDLISHKQGGIYQMMECYNQHGGNIIAVKNVPRSDVSKYGIVDILSEENNIFKVKALVEKPTPDKAPSTLSIVGRYILQPEIFDYLALLERGANNEIQLTDSMAKLIDTQPFHGLKFKGQHFDCGSASGFTDADIAYTLKFGHNSRHYLQQENKAFPQ